MWNFFFTVFLLVPLRKVLFRYVVRLIAMGSNHVEHLEVERKFFLGSRDLEQVKQTLAAENFYLSSQSEIVDWFLPTSQKREMLRIRREKEQQSVTHILTMKRWVDTVSGGKEREEIEKDISSYTALALILIGRFVEGSTLLSLSKRRSTYLGLVADRDASVSLDEAKDLGKYSGNYLEIEVLTPAGEDTGEIGTRIIELAARITGDAPIVKESYRRLYEMSVGASK